MRSERGQATVEWVGMVLLASVVLGALGAVGPSFDGRSLGGLIAHRIACAAERGCDGGDRELVEAYGSEDAELLRRHMPGLVFEPGERQLPVDWRKCRAVECAEAPDDPDLDAHRTERGRRATAFTRVVRRGGRRYLQYWFYYPDSNTTLAGSDRVWRDSPLLQLAGLALNGSTEYPGYHRDDWEGYAVRLDRDGRAVARTTSHGHWQWCKHSDCRDEWGPSTGWTRVSRGSHSGHVPVARRGIGLGRRPSRSIPPRYDAQVPGTDLRERTSTPDGVRLIPLEGVPRKGYRRLDPDVKPPWLKDAYRNPESPGS